MIEMKLLGAMIVTFIAVCLPLAAHADNVIATNDAATITSNTASARGVIGKTTLSPTGHDSGTVSPVKHQRTAEFVAPAPEPGILLLLGTALIATGILVRRVAA
jgi:hypothetical protein